MDKFVWVFNGAKKQFPDGIFEHLEEAENWIKENKLTGTLTKYPLNIGVFDWAEERGLLSEKLKEKRKNSIFVGGFTTATMEHFHYENGT